MKILKITICLLTLFCIRASAEYDPLKHAIRVIEESYGDDVSGGIQGYLAIVVN